jgi:flagellar biosynthesis chaperone FliJ
MKYPLEQIAQIKVKRLEEAEKLLKEKKRLLEVELEKLKKAEEKRDLVKKHRQDKQEGTTSDKIITHERYLKKIVDEELKSEEKKVVDQKKIVTKAEEEVEKARKDRLKKNQDVEKLKLHKTEWEKEALYEEMKKEAIETDEMGSSTHSLKKSARRKEGL